MINGVGLVMTGFVLILVVLTKFLAGAWISIAAMVVIYSVMVAIRRHYDHVATELAPAEESPMLPARNHAVVLVSKVHLPRSGRSPTPRAPGPTRSLRSRSTSMTRTLARSSRNGRRAAFRCR